MTNQLPESKQQPKTRWTAVTIDWMRMHRGRAAAVGVAVVLGLVAIGIAFWGVTGRLSLLVTIPLFCAAGYAGLSADGQKRLREWIVERALSVTAVVLMWVLVTAVILWAIVNFWWQPGYDRQVTAVALNEQGMYVTVSHPGGALADGQPVTIRLNIQNSGDVTQTVGVTAVLPTDSQLQFATPPTLPDISVAPHSLVTQTVSLVNANLAANIRETQPVTITLQIPGVVGAAPTTLVVEGVWGLRLRSLVNSTVNKASPVVILIAFLVPGLVQLMQQYVKEIKARQQESRQELEMRQKREAAQLQEQQQQHVNQLMEKVRHNILAEDWPKTEQILTQLNHLTWPTVEWRGRETAVKLLALANLTIQPEDIAAIVQECAAWADECVTAFLNAWGKARQREDADRQTYFAALKKVRRLLPIGKVSGDLQDRLASVEVAIISWEKGHYEFQPVRDWPKPPQRPILSPAMTTLFVAGIPGKRDPFAHEKAEEDLYFLFGFREGWTNAFWGGHLLFNALFAVDRTTLVWAAPGNGRTTLAYALHHYAAQREVFALHLPGSPQPDEIRVGLITHLLDFTLTHPTYLRQLTVTQRQLLARLFVSIQSAASLRARIENILKEVYSVFSTLPENDRDDVAARLQLLARDVTTIEIHHPPEFSWAGEIATLVQSLGFARLLLILDAGDSDEELSWVKDSLWPALLPWQRQGLFTILFLPDTGKIQEGIIKLRQFNQYQLSWNLEQFTRMLQWRYKAFAGSREAIEQHFAEEDGFDYLTIQCGFADMARYSPKLYIKLWQHLMPQLTPGSLITKDHVKSMLEEMKQTVHSSLITERKIEERAVIGKLETESPIREDRLRQILANYFNESELRNLCFDLGIKDEEFPSGSGYAREMVKYFKRHNRLTELTVQIQHLRPKIPLGKGEES